MNKDLTDAQDRSLNCKLERTTGNGTVVFEDQTKKASKPDTDKLGTIKDSIFNIYLLYCKKS